MSLLGDDDSDRIDYKAFRETLRSADNSLSFDRIDSLTKEFFSGKLLKPLEKTELKRKLYFSDLNGFSV